MTIERPMFPPRAGATKEEAWHRRHALQIACALPDTPDDCLIILRLATQLVTDFLMQSDEAQSIASEPRDPLR